MTQQARPFEGKTVAIDFDGVLHGYQRGWTGEEPLDPPVPGSREAVQWFIDRGATVVVMTTRAQTERGMEATIEWLEANDYPDVKVTNIKVPAVAYIDDRGVHFDPAAPDWVDVQERALALALRG